MVRYVCQKCSKIFNKKFLFDQHNNNKYPCSKKNNNNNRIITYECKHCYKNFDRKDSLIRHLKTCKYLNNNNNNNNYNIKCEKSFNNSKIIKSNINSNNTKNIINIYLINYDDHYNEKMTIKEFAEILEGKDDILIEFIKKIHFNPDKPQYHNIYYPDKKSTGCSVYNNNRLNCKKINDVIYTLLDVKLDDLKIILNDMKNVLDKKFVDKMKKCYETLEDGTINERIKNRKKIISFLKPLFYDNHEMVAATLRFLKLLKNNKIDKKNMLPEIMHKVKFIEYLLILSRKQDNINDIDYQLIYDKIIDINNINMFNSIINILIKSAYFGKKITNKMIYEQINLENKINNIYLNID